MKVLILHGPNLNLVGQREPAIYGALTLEEIDAKLADLASELGLEIECLQSNHEGELIDRLQRAPDDYRGVLLNPGGLTHTSVALRDGLVGIGVPFVEVHLSNTAGRERFRRHSYLAPVALGVVYGFGVDSYLLGLRGLVSHLEGR